MYACRHGAKFSKRNDFDCTIEIRYADLLISPTLDDRDLSKLEIHLTFTI